MAIETEVTDAARLRSAGLRVTGPRLAVLQALQESPHIDTGQILTAVRTRLPSVSHQAIYDCLHALTTAGVVRRIHPAGTNARYELRVADNHHHLVCRGCGAIVDIDCVRGSAPCLEASETHGFEIDEAEVVFWGRCPSCTTTAYPEK